MKYYTVLLLVFVLSCTTTTTTTTAPGVLEPAPGAADYMLTGHYHQDKPFFFPNGRNSKKEDLFQKALLEGAESQKDPFTPNRNFSPEQNLAIEYDVAAQISKFNNKDHWQYGIVLGKVGRWKEAADAFRKEIEINSNSAGSWGNLGVSEHILGNHKKAIESFNMAVMIEPSYFNSRKVQKRFFDSSNKGEMVD